MDLALLVYGISLLAGIKAFWITTAIVCGALTFFSVIYATTDCEERSYYSPAENAKRVENGKAAWRWVRRLIITGIISAWIIIFIPTEKTAYTMVGAYAAQKVAENEKVQQMSGKVLTIIEQKLDQYIDEGIEEVETKTKKSRK
jgi:TRAP-type C4-dicarboxylate transport system permease large subunit